jgi:hypothetical protein
VHELQSISIVRTAIQYTTTQIEMHNFGLLAFFMMTMSAASEISITLYLMLSSDATQRLWGRAIVNGDSIHPAQSVRRSARSTWRDVSYVMPAKADVQTGVAIDGMYPGFPLQFAIRRGDVNSPK